jgi:hypothetical protein
MDEVVYAYCFLWILGFGVGVNGVGGQPLIGISGSAFGLICCIEWKTDIQYINCSPSCDSKYSFEL